MCADASDMRCMNSAFSRHGFVTPSAELRLRLVNGILVGATNERARRACWLTVGNALGRGLFCGRACPPLHTVERSCAFVRVHARSCTFVQRFLSVALAAKLAVF